MLPLTSRCIRTSNLYLARIYDAARWLRVVSRLWQNMLIPFFHSRGHRQSTGRQNGPTKTDVYDWCDTSYSMLPFFVSTWLWDAHLRSETCWVYQDQTIWGSDKIDEKRCKYVSTIISHADLYGTLSCFLSGWRRSRLRSTAKLLKTRKPSIVLSARQYDRRSHPLQPGIRKRLLSLSTCQFWGFLWWDITL